MATPTYTLIEEQVLGSSAASVTFSAIAGTYKDLVIECVAKHDGGGNNSLGVRLNSDTGSNYSDTYLSGNGSSAGSGRHTSGTYAMPAGTMSPSGGSFTPLYVNIMSYASTSVYKTMLGRGSESEAYVMECVGLWRNTAAVTTVTLAPEFSTNFVTGSTFRLWGIA